MDERRFIRVEFEVLVGLEALGDTWEQAAEALRDEYASVAGLVADYQDSAAYRVTIEPPALPRRPQREVFTVMESHKRL